MYRLFLLFLVAIVIGAFGCGDSAEATGINFYANPNTGAPDYTYTRSGGYDAYAEYGPDHVLATLQGDAYQVHVSSYLNYYYVIPLHSTISVTYSLSGEGTALNDASLHMEHGVRFYWHYVDPNFTTYPSYLGGSYYGYYWNNEGDYKHDSWEYLDQTFSYSWGSRPYYPSLNAGNLFLIKMTAKISGSSYASADAFYSATMYADPIVKVGDTVINPLNGYYNLTDFEANGGQYVNPLEPTPAPIPEPSTITLLGVGLLGLVGVSRKAFKQ